MTAHACRIDYSQETGSLVVCTCGFALGPFREKANAVKAAGDHRRAHAEPNPKPTPEQRQRHNDAARASRAAKRERATGRDAG